MISTQIIGLLEYEFGVQFDGSIDVNLNIAYFKFLQDTAVEFSDEVANVKRESKLAKAASTVKSQRTDSSTADTDSASAHSKQRQQHMLTYKALKPIVLEP